jgi:hypothetical protein
MSLVWSPVVVSIRFETDNTTSTSHQLSTCLLLNYRIPQGQTFFAIFYSLQVCLSMHVLLSQFIFLETFPVFDSQYTDKAFLMFDSSCRFFWYCFDALTALYRHRSLLGDKPLPNLTLLPSANQVQLNCSFSHFWLPILWIDTFSLELL